MHRNFRKLLDNASGQNEFVVAVNLDIRGFSSFCQTVEAAQAALFISKVYAKLLDEYFPGTSFAKPTGDGLLLTYSAEDDVPLVVQSTVDSCLDVLKDFSKFCSNDPRINFTVPQQIGIGLSRGPVCRLISKGKVLDCSGKVLNLASRLMDFARPSGILFDSSLGFDILTAPQKKLFAKDKIFLKGVAEREPVNIYYTKKLTRIPPSARNTLDETKWRSRRVVKTFGEWQAHLGVAKINRIFLNSTPTDPARIEVEFERPVYGDTIKRGDPTHGWDVKFKYGTSNGRPTAQFHADEWKRIEAALQRLKTTDNCQILLRVTYPISQS